MDMPNIEDITFPIWLIGICDSKKYFDKAKDLLVEKHGFVYSPLEQKSTNSINSSLNSLILPIPDLDLNVYFAKSEKNWFKGWGVGRARFDNTYCKQRGGFSFEFKYFFDSCSWDQIKDNPMREASKQVLDIIKPFKLKNYKGQVIQNPYS